MQDINGETLNEHQLLKFGLEKLDEALSYIMEMQGAEGTVIAHFLHAALTIGEKVLDTIDAQ